MAKKGSVKLTTLDELRKKGKIPPADSPWTMTSEPGRAVLTLPFPPSVNNLYESVGKLRRKSKRARKFRTTVWLVIDFYRLENPGLFFPLVGPVSVTLAYSQPNAQRRDLDNLLKAVLDSLQDRERSDGVFTRPGIISNDSQITSIAARFVEPKKPGQVVVEITEVSDDE